jgi:hypothetical protein
MDMDKDTELRARLQNADPGQQAPELPAHLVALATRSKPRFQVSFKNLRIGLGSVAVAGLAIVSSFSLPGLMAPQPLFTLASGSGANALSATAESAPVSDAKMGMIWPGYVEYNYLAGDLSKETGSGSIYQAKLVGEPEEILRNLMNFFDMTGEIKKDEWSTDLYPSYSVQSKSDNGIETNLSIYFSGTGSWSYSQWDSTYWNCGITEDSAAGSEDSTQACEQPKSTPELVPSEEQMRSQASELFANFGTVIPATDFKVYRDEWGGSAWAEITMDGIKLPISVSIGWDGKGNISYASGHSFELVDRGEFKTISAFDAVARLGEGSWYGAPPASFYENQTVSVARDMAVSVEQSESVDSVEPTEGAVVEDNAIAVDEPMVNEEPVEPKIVDMTIERSETALLGVWDAQGGFWLVPGYVLFNDQGWFDSIIAVEDGVIELPKYEEIMPLIEPAPATKEG